MKRLVVVCLAAALAGPVLADPPHAKPPPTPAPRMFISPSGEPFRQGPTMPDPLKAWFDQADTAHVGYLDRAAFRADATRYFKVLDENGDGVIDGFEVSDYEHKIVPEYGEWIEGRYPGQFGPDRQHGGARRAPAGGRGGNPITQLIDEPEPVSGADFNLDSHVTFAEWMRATDQRFDLLDTDKTGRLTLDQLRVLVSGKPAVRKK